MRARCSVVHRQAAGGLSGGSRGPQGRPGASRLTPEGQTLLTTTHRTKCSHKHRRPDCDLTCQ